MNLLIVDDEASAIEAVLHNLEWERLPFKEVYTAANLTGAVEVLGQQSIDVILSDIEMPMGSGIELLEWIEANHAGLSCVLMTCHADFSYAQKALRLGVVDYILKPLDFIRLQEVLVNTAHKLNATRRLEEVSSHWDESRRDVAKQFWKDLFIGDISPSHTSIQNYWQQRHIDFDLYTPCVPILLSVKQWENVCSREDQKLMMYALRNMADELFRQQDTCCEVLPFSDNQILVIFRCDTALDDLFTGVVMRACESIAVAAHQHLKARVNCYMGETVDICHVPDQLEALVVMDLNNVVLSNQVYLLSNFIGYYNDFRGYDSEKLREWQHLMRAGEFTGLYNNIMRTVEQACDSGCVNRQYLKNVERELYILLYGYLHDHNVFMVELFDSVCMPDLSEKATQSLDNFLQWARHVLDRLETHRKESVGETDPVIKTKRFIEENLAEELSVEAVAGHVHLNSDYLGRIFKRQVGSALSRYIIQRKIDRAKWLMENSQKSIGEIAEMVGYYNYSSFNRVFSKEVGMSPQDYKKSINCF